MKQSHVLAMVDYVHDENVYRRAAKRRRLKIAAYSLIGTLIIVVAAVIFDGLSSDTTVTTQTSDQTLGRTIERAVFDEEDFRFTADTTWQKIDSRETTDFHYQSFSDNLVRRDLRIYVDNTPPEFALTYVLPIEVERNKIVPLTISPHCKELVPNKKSPRDQMTSWAGAPFLCDPDSTTYVVGTSHNKTGYRSLVPGSSASHRYFFVYRDLEAEPRLETFGNLLSTFEAK